MVTLIINAHHHLLSKCILWRHAHTIFVHDRQWSLSCLSPNVCVPGAYVITITKVKREEEQFYMSQTTVRSSSNVGRMLVNRVSTSTNFNFQCTATNHVPRKHPKFFKTKISQLATPTLRFPSSVFYFVTEN